MNYHFEENSNSQKLKFEINFKEHDEIINIDNVKVTLKDILTSKNQEYIKEIDPDKKSKLIIRGQQKKFLIFFKFFVISSNFYNIIIINFISFSFE